MVPVGQQRSNEDIGHARQEIRPRQQLMMIADPIEQGGLGEQDQKGEHRVQYRGLMQNGAQAIQNDPV